jgi:hypothetical protein
MTIVQFFNLLLSKLKSPDTLRGAFQNERLERGVAGVAFRSAEQSERGLFVPAGRNFIFCASKRKSPAGESGLSIPF